MKYYCLIFRTDMICIMKNDIIQGISLNVVLLTSNVFFLFVFLSFFSNKGAVSFVLSLTHVHLKQYVTFIFHV